MQNKQKEKHGPKSFTRFFSRDRTFGGQMVSKETSN